MNDSPLRPPPLRVMPKCRRPPDLNKPMPQLPAHVLFWNYFDAWIKAQELSLTMAPRGRRQGAFPAPQTEGISPSPKKNAHVESGRDIEARLNVNSSQWQPIGSARSNILSRSRSKRAGRVFYASEMATEKCPSINAGRLVEKLAKLPKLRTFPSGSEDSQVYTQSIIGDARRRDASVNLRSRLHKKTGAASRFKPTLHTIAEDGSAQIEYGAWVLRKAHRRLPWRRQSKKPPYDYCLLSGSRLTLFKPTKSVALNKATLKSSKRDSKVLRLVQRPGIKSCRIRTSTTADRSTWAEAICIAQAVGKKERGFQVTINGSEV